MVFVASAEFSNELSGVGSCLRCERLAVGDGDGISAFVDVLVGVDVAVLVGASVAVLVGVAVGVAVAVDVAVAVLEGASVAVAVGVFDGV